MNTRKPQTCFLLVLASALAPSALAQDRFFGPISNSGLGHSNQGIPGSTWHSNQGGKNPDEDDPSDLWLQMSEPQIVSFHAGADHLGVNLWVSPGSPAGTSDRLTPDDDVAGLVRPEFSTGSSPAAVPEPASLLLWSLGIALLRRR